MQINQDVSEASLLHCRFVNRNCWSNLAVTDSLPNQELSGAKSELQRGTVGVCSSHKRGGQPSYNLPAAHLRFTPQSLQVCLIVHFNK